MCVYKCVCASARVSVIVCIFMCIMTDLLTFEGGTNTPWLGLHLKYLTPDWEPSFLPPLLSSSTPIQILHEQHVQHVQIYTMYMYMYILYMFNMNIHVYTCIHVHVIQIYKNTWIHKNSSTAVHQNRCTRYIQCTCTCNMYM